MTIEAIHVQDINADTSILVKQQMHSCDFFIVEFS